MRWFVAVASILAIALAAEEAGHGLILGLSPLAPLCDALGGKRGINPHSRCYSRLCYWIGDCGHWASPARWLNRLEPGDPLSKIIFRLGEPDRREGEDLVWQCWKAEDAMCKAIIRDGRLVALER